MKKALLIILILLIFLCTLITYCAYQYYAPPQLRQPHIITDHDNYNDTLRIAYIGDSWAYMHNNHNCRISKIIEDSIQRPISVHSYGICGLTSKEIYENLFDNSDFKLFMQMRKYDYCIISAGINDTYKKMSCTYYKKSMEGIIETLLANHIHPIVLEIPNYNIIQTYTNQKFGRKLLRHISMLINKTPMDCKKDFRKALDELIKEKNYHKKVSVIRYLSWDKINDEKYCNDGMHLNQHGYDILDSIIIENLRDQIVESKTYQ